jgi:transcriptional regulator with XRE-family HTH domain
VVVVTATLEWRPVDPVAIGRRIREKRLEAGLSQRGVAFQGCSAAYISRLESGSRIASGHTLEELARRIGTTRTYLETGEDSRLLPLMIGYLESRGWYFDWEHIHDVWGSDSPGSLDKQPDAIRSLHGWTVPQWGEYWSSDHLEPKGPKPKQRRYESLKDALWSQMLREEEPEQFAVFFQGGI